MKLSSRHCALATLLPRESAPGTHSVGGWVGPGISLDTSEQRKNSCSCRELNLFHPVAILTELLQLSKNDDIHSTPKLFIDLTQFVHWACAQRLLPVFMSSYFMKWLMECKIPSSTVAPKCYLFHEIIVKNVFFSPPIRAHSCLQAVRPHIIIFVTGNWASATGPE
jgi:hypothetical protein